ncbi:MAG: hypothetical protein KAI83_19640 [Thiomargarita sp.]|nr:hypothetical protein [Thiomargarita sp.]
MTQNNIPPRERVNAIKLSQGEHAGSPLQPLNTLRLVGRPACMLLT